MSVFNVCTPDMNICTPKCKTPLGATYECDSPCSCYGVQDGSPTFTGEQCVSVSCGGFGGIGTANSLLDQCYGTLEIAYGVKRMYYLTGDKSGLWNAIRTFAGGAPGYCGCPLYKTCDFRYSEAKALIGTTDAYPGITTSNPRTTFTIAQGDPLPVPQWYNYYGSEGNTFNGKYDTPAGGNGTVMYRWWPYIDYKGVVWCGGCQDNFANGVCSILFTLGCSSPFCACCCGCYPCNYNNFGESSCTGGPLGNTGYYNLAGNIVMETIVVIIYRWLSGPNASNVWYQHSDSSGTSDFPTGTGNFSSFAQDWFTVTSVPQSNPIITG